MGRVGGGGGGGGEEEVIEPLVSLRTEQPPFYICAYNTKSCELYITLVNSRRALYQGERGEKDSWRPEPLSLRTTIACGRFCTEAEKDTVLRFALRACVLRFAFRFAFCACVLRFAFRSALEFCVSHFALRFPVAFCCRSDLILLFSSLNTPRGAEKSKLSQHSGQLMCESFTKHSYERS